MSGQCLRRYSWTCSHVLLYWSKWKIGMEEACTYNLAELIRLSYMIPNFKVWVFGRLNAHYVFHSGVTFKQNKTKKFRKMQAFLKLRPSFVCLAFTWLHDCTCSCSPQFVFKWRLHVVYHLLEKTSSMQSLRSYGKHSSAIVAITAIIATTIVEIDFSSTV